MKRSLALLLAVSVALATAAPARAAEDVPRPPKARKAGRHKGLGLTIGAVAGTILGLYTALTLGDDSSSMGEVFAVWTGFAVGGALAGYAAGGGFSSDVDAALERGRARVRTAGLRPAGRAVQGGERGAALARLRLSVVPGLGLPDADQGEAGWRIAEAR